MYSITNAGKGDYRQALADLWIECFGDDEVYTKQVFVDMYRPLRTLVLLDEDKVIGSLHYTKYTLKAQGKEYFGIYVYGVCVKKEYRHRGLATKLMQTLIENHSTPIHSFFFLISAADELYEKLGFRYVTCKYEHEVEGVQKQANITEAPLGVDELLTLYNSKFQSDSLQRDDRIAGTMISLYGNDAVAFRLDGKTIGYALEDGDCCEELVYDKANEDVIFAHLSKSNIKVRDDSKSGKEVRKVYALPIGDFDVKLFNGCYISPEI